MAEPQKETPGARPAEAALAQGGSITSLTVQARRDQSSGFSFYGPGAPLPAVVADQPVRQWDFQPGYNQQITPRHSEPFSFAHLRAFANVELVRMAIETRKDQLENLDWQIKPRDKKKKRDEDSRIQELERFFAKPDGQTHFASFMRALDEDLLAIDAPVLEARRTRGGKLLGLDLVDGATINLLVDDSGRRPRDPLDIAYQQIIKGVVWANLANRDLFYLPRNVRTNHIYGFGPVEQIIVTINTILRRQGSQLAYFTEGNVPAGLLNAPENWSADQIRDLQEWFDQRLAGNQGEQRKLIWGPHGTVYNAFKDAPVKDEFDEWLARLVAFAFSLPPTPFIRQMNRSTAEEDSSRSLKEGLEPLKRWRKRWIDELIASELGAPDLEFGWVEEIEIDPVKQAEIDDRNLRNGSAILDEVRDARGQDALPNGAGARPLVYMGDAPIPLEAIDALIERKTEPPQPAPGAENDEGEEGQTPEGKGGGPNKPKTGKKAAPKAKKKPEIKEKSARTEKLEKAAWPSEAQDLSIDRPKALRAAAALSRAIQPILTKAGIDAAAQIERRLEKADRDPDIEAKRLADAIDLKVLLGLSDPLEAELEIIGLDAIELAIATIGPDDAALLVNRVSPLAVAYAKDRAAELVSIGGEHSLIDSTRDMLRSVIYQGLSGNIGRDAIADEIMSAMAFSEARADLIANTEIAMANAFGKDSAWQEVEAQGAQMVKQWFVSALEGVCAPCQSNADQGEIPFKAEFESGDKMEPAHPACRCVTTARVIEPAKKPGPFGN